MVNEETVARLEKKIDSIGKLLEELNGALADAARETEGLKDQDPRMESFYGHISGQQEVLRGLIDRHQQFTALFRDKSPENDYPYRPYT